MTKRNTSTAPPRNTSTAEQGNTCVDNIPNRRANLVTLTCACGRSVAIVAGARAWCTRCGKPMRPSPTKGGDDAAR